MKYLKSLALITLLGAAGFAFAQQAQVTTKDATNRGVTEARLVGDVSFVGAVPFGQAFFEYGRTEVYGRTTPQRSLIEGGEFTEKATGLNADSGYNFRAVLVGADGQLILGENKTFTTKRTDTDTPDVSDLFDEDGDDDDEEENETPAPPAEGETFTDASGQSCLGGDAVPIREIISTSSNVDNNVGTLGSEGIVTAQRGPITGYRCPTDEELAADAEDDINIADLGGGGTLIPNGTGVETRQYTGSDFTDRESDGLVRCGGDDQPECDFNRGIEMIQRIINFFLYFAIIIFVGLMTYAGVKYMTSGGNMDATKTAKKYMTNGLIGILIIAFAWLGVNTALGILTKDDSGAQQFLDN